MIEFKITCAGAPLVIEGKIGERKFFYRSRHGRWRIELDDTEIASGADEGQDSQDIEEALRLIGKHCYRTIWDFYNKQEDVRWE